MVCRCGAGESIRALWTVHFWDYSPRGLAAFLAVYFVSAAWTSGLAIPSGAPLRDYFRSLLSALW